ncbi:hypothetical protein [Pontibacter sp. G13]|uniref:hypothetical protein n=1 Tax=Pontibacter sp. G13 TaxID=3074898 RepID=UPI002889EE22|nr:hypothetical protein [Pontibacter sp. G13]WNJ18257.1 hypothetical protein RJD25_25680 [Pontibacter sp. G13]
MKYLLFILTGLLGLITLFFTWIYIQRANLDYNPEGRFFSAEDGVVFHEQAKIVYGMLALLGLILTVVCMIPLLKRKTQLPKNA